MGIIPLLPDWIVMAAWVYGGFRFYNGFDATNYQRNYRIPLAVAWPLFALLNGKYRSNFMKALKGSDD